MPGDTAPVNDFTSSLANFGAGRKNSFKLSTRLARECRGRNTPALAWSGILGCLSVRRYFRLAKKPWKASFRGTARLGTESLGRSFTPSWGDGFKSGWGISFNIMVSRHGAVLRLDLAQYIRFLIALSLVFALAVTLAWTESDYAGTVDGRCAARAGVWTKSVCWLRLQRPRD